MFTLPRPTRSVKTLDYRKYRSECAAHQVHAEGLNASSERLTDEAEVGGRKENRKRRINN